MGLIEKAKRALTRKATAEDVKALVHDALSAEFQRGYEEGFLAWTRAAHPCDSPAVRHARSWAASAPMAPVALLAPVTEPVTGFDDHVDRLNDA